MPSGKVLDIQWKEIITMRRNHQPSAHFHQKQKEALKIFGTHPLDRNKSFLNEALTWKQIGVMK